MKDKLIRLLKVLLGIVLIVGSVSVVSKILSYKNPSSHEHYYKDNDEYQVLFIGNSHVLNGFSPMFLWNEYGYTSYNLADMDSYLAEGYWVLINALDYSKPKVVVVDIFETDLDEKYDVTSAEGLHNGMDAIPLSLNKIRMWYDLLSEKDKHLYKDRVDFIFPLRGYHSRWNSLTEDDFKEHIDYNNGSQVVYRVAKPKDEYPVYSSKKVADGSTVSLDYLKKIFELCKDEGIEVIVTNLSFNASDEMVPYLNKATKMAEEYGAYYIDYVHMDGLVNPVTDYFTNSKNTHLNKMGMDEVTDYLGKYIEDNKLLQREDRPEIVERWNGKYSDYKTFKMDQLSHKDELVDMQELYSTLITVFDSDYSACISVTAGTALYDDVITNSFINELVEDSGAEPVTDKPDLFMIRDSVDGKTSIMIGNGEKEYNCSFGKVFNYSYEGGITSLYDENWDTDYFMPMSEDTADMKILIIDNENGKKLFTKEYYVQEDGLMGRIIIYDND